jgi:hypothetical protein
MVCSLLGGILPLTRGPVLDPDVIVSVLHSMDSNRADCLQAWVILVTTVVLWLRRERKDYKAQPSALLSRIPVDFLRDSFADFRITLDGSPPAEALRLLKQFFVDVPLSTFRELLDQDAIRAPILRVCADNYVPEFLALLALCPDKISYERILNTEIEFAFLIAHSPVPADVCLAAFQKPDLLPALPFALSNVRSFSGLDISTLVARLPHDRSFFLMCDAMAGQIAMEIPESANFPARLTWRFSVPESVPPRTVAEILAVHPEDDRLDSHITANCPISVFFWLPPARAMAALRSLLGESHSWPKKDVMSLCLLNCELEDSWRCALALFTGDSGWLASGGAVDTFDDSILTFFFGMCGIFLSNSCSQPGLRNLPFWESLPTVIFALFGSIARDLPAPLLETPSVQFAFAAFLSFSAMEVRDMFEVTTPEKVTRQISCFTPLFLNFDEAEFSFEEQITVPKPRATFAFAPFFRAKVPLDPQGANRPLRDAGLAHVAVDIAAILSRLPPDERSIFLREAVQDSRMWLHGQRISQPIMLEYLLENSDDDVKPVIRAAIAEECITTGREFPSRLFSLILDRHGEIPGVGVALRYWAQTVGNDITEFVRVIAEHSSLVGLDENVVVAVAKVIVRGESGCDPGLLRAALRSIARSQSDLSMDLLTMAGSPQLAVSEYLQSAVNRFNDAVAPRESSMSLVKEFQKFCREVLAVRVAADFDRIVMAREFEINEWVIERMREWRNPFRRFPAVSVPEDIRRTTFQARFGLSEGFYAAVASVGMCTGSVLLFVAQNREMVVYVPQDQSVLILLLRNVGLDAETFEGVPLVRFGKEQMQFESDGIVVTLTETFTVRLGSLDEAAVKALQKLTNAV